MILPMIFKRGSWDPLLIEVWRPAWKVWVKTENFEQKCSILGIKGTLFFSAPCEVSSRDLRVQEFTSSIINKCISSITALFSLHLRVILSHFSWIIHTTHRVTGKCSNYITTTLQYYCTCCFSNCHITWTDACCPQYILSRYLVENFKDYNPGYTAFMIVKSIFLDIYNYEEKIYSNQWLYNYTPVTS